MHGKIANEICSLVMVLKQSQCKAGRDEGDVTAPCHDGTNSHFKLEITTEIALLFQVQIVKFIFEIVYIL